MLWLFLACSQPSPERNALDERVEFGIAWRECKGLVDVEKAGQCALDVLQTRNVISAERCAEISSERWRSECFFVAAETGKGELSKRYELCSKAGEYARDCGFHLWQRDLMDLEPGNPATADHRRDAHILLATRPERQKRCRRTACAEFQPGVQIASRCDHTASDAVERPAR